MSQAKQMKRCRNTGRDPVYAIRLPNDLVTSIELWAKANGHFDRSSAIRAMIARAIGVQPSDKSSQAVHDLGDPTVAALQRGHLVKILREAEDLAEQIGDITTAYLIEGALDEARLRQFTSTA